MKRGKNKIKHGDVSLDDSYFDVKNHKVRVTTFIDGDVLSWLKQEAMKVGKGYQTLLNTKLRESMEGSPDDRIRAIVREEIRKSAP
jgi:uncharacterized protein (DUF4415 family)